MNLSAIEQSVIDECTKGVPGGIAPLTIADIGKRGWNLLSEDVPLPACVLKQSALEHNARWMRGFLQRTGVLISPHGKTTMSPQLFRRQIEDGAWAITVGTVHQLQVARHFGFARVVLANQLVGRQGLRYVLDELERDPNFDFYCLVDSVALVEQMAKAARERAVGRPIQLFIEGGFAGGRTGVRDLETAAEVGRAIKAAGPYLALRGVEGFEGLMSGADAADRVTQFIDFLADIARLIDRENLAAPGPLILTAGGSAFYDIVIERFRTLQMTRPTMILTRSGCYLTHDSAMYVELFEGIRTRSATAAELGRPEAAIEVWAYVQSRPEPTRALVTMGKRDVSFDAHMPIPFKWHRPGGNTRVPMPIPEGHKITALNDQHGYLELPASSPLEVGDLVGFGVSHPCLTFDRWQVIYTVDDAYNITGAVRTYF